MASIRFILRPSMKAGRQPGSLSLRVIHGRKPKTVSTGCRLYPEEWDEANQAILYPGDDPERRNYLSAVEQEIISCRGKANGIIRKLEDKGPYTVGDVITGYRRSTDDGKLLGYASTLAEELRENKQYRTSKAYMTVCRGLVSFNKGVDIPLGQISAGLIRRFESHLKEGGKQPNTISYYMRNLRAIYNKAVEAGRIPGSQEKPFAGIFTGVEETKKRALSTDQVNRLQNIDLDGMLSRHQPGTRQYRQLENLSRARRLFFFCLYAQGMCFVDMCHLKKGNVRDGVIRYYRRKTGKHIEVPINDGMRTIIDSFAQEMAGSEYLFPPLRDGRDNPQLVYETALRTQNRRLKRLAALAGVDKCLATHVARHSWATICKHELLPVSVISEGLGHSSEKMTRKYLACFDHSILGEAGKTVLTAISRPLGLFSARL